MTGTDSRMALRRWSEERLSRWQCKEKYDCLSCCFSGWFCRGYSTYIVHGQNMAPATARWSPTIVIIR